MSRTKGKQSKSAASGRFACLVIKPVVEEFVDPYPMFDGMLGHEDHIQEGEWHSGIWRPAKRPVKTDWRKGPMIARLKFVDITSGGSTLPSMVFQNDKGEFALMTLDHFRTATINRKLELVDGMITGTFRFVRYSTHDYYTYVEIV